MQCERLIKLIKSWYIHVRDETMAPARMVSFMERHAKTCEVCLQDPDLKEEFAKITELVLPESKIPKAVRQKNEQAAAQKENELKDEEENVEDEIDDTEDNSEADLDDEDLELAEDTPKLIVPPDI